MRCQVGIQELKNTCFAQLRFRHALGEYLQSHSIRGRVALAAYEFVGAEPLQPDGVSYSTIAPKQAFAAARLLAFLV